MRWSELGLSDKERIEALEQNMEDLQALVKNVIQIPEIRAYLEDQAEFEADLEKGKDNG